MSDTEYDSAKIHDTVTTPEEAAAHRHEISKSLPKVLRAVAEVATASFSTVLSWTKDFIVTKEEADRISDPTWVYRVVRDRDDLVGEPGRAARLPRVRHSRALRGGSGARAVPWSGPSCFHHHRSRLNAS